MWVRINWPWSWNFCFVSNVAQLSRALKLDFSVARQSEKSFQTEMRIAKCCLLHNRAVRWEQFNLMWLNWIALKLHLLTAMRAATMHVLSTQFVHSAIKWNENREESVLHPPFLRFDRLCVCSALKNHRSVSLKWLPNEFFMRNKLCTIRVEICIIHMLYRKHYGLIICMMYRIYLASASPCIVDLIIMAIMGGCEICFISSNLSNFIWVI